jgi:hypothetical protein
MGDPRNVAHAKKVSQEKHHKGDAAHSPKPAKKKRAVESSAVEPTEAAQPDQKSDPTKLEKSLAILAKLRELEFHSRANIEKLAELSLTIEDELKQKAFAEPIGDVYSAQEAFHSKISALIEAYQTECDRLKPAG